MRPTLVALYAMCSVASVLLLLIAPEDLGAPVLQLQSVFVVSFVATRRSNCAMVQCADIVLAVAFL